MRKLLHLALCCLLAVPLAAQGLGGKVGVGGKYGGAGCVQTLINSSGLISNTTLVGWSSSAFFGTTTQGTLTSPPLCPSTGATVTEDSTASQTHGTQINPTISLSGASRTYSVYAERVVGTRNAQVEFAGQGFGGGAGGSFDLSNCTTHGAAFAFGTWSGASFTASASTGSWCKLSVTATTAAITSVFLQVYLEDASFNSTYSGDGTSAIGVWGADFR